MRSGDIVFVRSTSLISKLVRFFDKGKFSHVAIAISENEVLETNWNMKSKIVPFYYEDYEIVSLDLTDKQRKDISNNSSTYEGFLYDYFQIIGYLIKSNLNNPRYLICSELVYLVLNDIDFIEDETLKDVTPNRLYKILTQEVAE